MASGMARGAAVRGKRVAFGDGTKIYWDQNSEVVFRNNPNIARPGTQRSANLEWVPFYRGNRMYNTQGDGRWIWNYDFRPVPGEVVFDRIENKFRDRVGERFVVIEPNVPAFKSCGVNKQWPLERYEEVAHRLREKYLDVVQFDYGRGRRLKVARQVPTSNIRFALAALSRASLYIGPEGGLHHGAAAVGIPAVVLFGGFVPPAVTGYPNHANLTGGAEACGSFNRCEHCIAAMQAISVDEVMGAAGKFLADG